MFWLFVPFDLIADQDMEGYMDYEYSRHPMSSRSVTAILIPIWRQVAGGMHGGSAV